ncbi:small ribosomal subunit biogenesis GTPase RsgA [Thiohalocapsa marina]|uniref:Small ribosomal subunit biogenesis GTPase RsgA n=1 Tax=Thiohalocapsa marina TaxID=424902 RepID=A0A5M8FM35_9GAMM|nr:small ribosomal subunit biogenesis GTPase RsgA [Thiohalocapsa marina]KAA6185070.1 small ribosomal subunit biogenesis GTPase RsgA [Thiohalocapsa marina]
MPRRRLSQRQIERIRAIQDRRRRRLEERTTDVMEQLDDAEPRAGRVVVRHGSNLAVEDDQGQVHHCLLRRNIGQPVCGDRVVWQPTGTAAGVVTALQPRDTVLSRPDYGGRDKPLAANISLIIVVVAPRPAPSGYLVDQYLVAAELIGVQALILANKMDLIDPPERGAFLQAFAHYPAIGYPLLPVSVKQDPQLEALRPHLAERTSILLGQSGVGKSSIVQALMPDRDIQIGRLSKATGLGRHTTSASTCYRLANGGHLIDSPGVRSFRLGAISRSQLEQGFREFAPFLGHCRFADCSHRHEPGCALRAACEQGIIAPQRMESFHHLAGLAAG